MDFLHSDKSEFLKKVRNWEKHDCVNFLMDIDLKLFSNITTKDKMDILINMDINSLKSKIVEIVQKSE